MNRQTVRLSLMLVISIAALLPRVVEAQSSRSASTGWTVPRTADGRPNLEGVWENNSATPLERPKQLAQKPRLTDEELETLKRRASTSFGPEAEAIFGDALYLALLNDTKSSGLGATGTYSQNWRPDRYFEHRTSLIEEPANGKLPPATAEGQRVRQASVGRFGRPAASAQEMSIQDRCIHYGFPDLFAAYMSVYRIVQNPDYIAIQMEKIHDTRIIPLDGRPHLSPALRNYMGDSRGKWEGDTLVVETTNFNGRRPFQGSTDKLRVIERFTRTAPDQIAYRFTVEDPAVWARPWTAEEILQATNGPIFEHACHEGNFGVANTLAGARLEEKLATEK